MTVVAKKRVIEELESNDFDEIENENEEAEAGSESEAENDETDADIEDEDGEGDDDEADGNVGWANTFAKLLQQERPKKKKYVALSKAKKLADKQKDAENDEPKLTFEIEKGEKSSDNEDDDDVKPSDEQLEYKKLELDEKNRQLLSLRVKPSPLDRERERALRRIATRGVVQLFNAMRTQQKDLVERLKEAGPLDHRRDAVLNNINKNQFLDVLMGGKRAKSENVDNPIKDEPATKREKTEERPSQWSVLRDDFMTNKKIASHWSDDDEDNAGAPIDDSD